MPVSAMARPMSWPGHSCGPPLNARCERLPCMGASRSGRICRVDVAGGQAEQQHVPGLDLLAAQLRVAGGPAAGDRGERRLVPQHLLDARRAGSCGRRRGCARKRGSVSTIRSVFAIRLAVVSYAGDQDQPQVLDDLVVGQPDGVLQQPGGEVVAGRGPLALRPAPAASP